MGSEMCIRDSQRAVDLYVDGELIAWFYEAPAPPRDLHISYETGRIGLWVPIEQLSELPNLSPWHRVVLQAWQVGEDRADFVTPPPAENVPAPD